MNPFRRLILSSIVLSFCCPLFAEPIPPQNVGPRKIIVITDMEPDDRLALQLMAEKLSPQDVAFVGTTLLNAERKAVLARRLLDQLGFSSVPVIQGSGGKPQEYERLTSSSAALDYAAEGATLISESDMQNAKADRSGRLIVGTNMLAQTILEYLGQNHKAGNRGNIDIVLLASPTDLLEGLMHNRKYAESIGTVHMMGGWVDAKDESGEIVKRSTYNWNMGFEAARVFLQYMKSKVFPFRVKLYSSHLIKPAFGGGSINSANNPEIIKALQDGAESADSLKDFQKAGASWDSHLVQKIPPLANIIGPHIGNQFTPADPLVMLGAINPDLVMASKSVDIQMNTSNIDYDRGFEVTVKENSNSHIDLIEKVDVELFQKEMLATLKNAPQRASEPRKKSGLSRRLTTGGATKCYKAHTQ